MEGFVMMNKLEVMKFIVNCLPLVDNEIQDAILSYVECNFDECIDILDNPKYSTKISLISNLILELYNCLGTDIFDKYNFAI